MRRKEREQIRRKLKPGMKLKLKFIKKGEEEIIQTEEFEVIRAYPFHVHLKKKSGLTECFSYWELMKRIKGPTQIYRSNEKERKYEW